MPNWLVSGRWADDQEFSMIVAAETDAKAIADARECAIEMNTIEGLQLPELLDLKAVEHPAASWQ